MAGTLDAATEPLLLQLLDAAATSRRCWEDDAISLAQKEVFVASGGQPHH
jgi:hypothetical protein